MIVIKKFTEKNIPYDLLLDADPSKELVMQYLSKGTLFCAYDNEKIIGEYLLTPLSSNVVEIINLAVAPAYQRQGIGSLLINHAINQSILINSREVLVGTACPLVPYYKRFGFVEKEIVKDFFITHYKEPVIDNGVLLKDKIILSLSI